MIRRINFRRGLTLWFWLYSLMIWAQNENSLPSTRKSISISQNWFYIEKSDTLPPKVKPEEKIPVHLPHSWNALDATDQVPGYRRSASWYERTLNIPDFHTSKRYILHFEGVNQQCKIYLNQQFLTHHIGGYLEFEVDLSPALRAGDNLLQIWVDNSYNPDRIPSQKADFILFGGITRDVWLWEVPKTYIQQCHFTTPQVSKTAASVQVDWETYLDKSTPFDAVQVKLLDHLGKVVLMKKISVKNFQSNGKVNLPELKNPKLWSPQDPYLYTLSVSLWSKEKCLDQCRQSVGFRWFEFKPGGAFYLNGERLLLRGTHRHEEHAGLGGAMPDSLHIQDMKMIKAMGANFVRLAHYPQDPSVYRACNELGLLVWDELPWCRGGMGGQVWKKNVRNYLKEMIHQHFNHPCIILWSLGNELNWLPDYPGGDQPDSLNAFIQELNILSHQLDPYRLTCLRKYYEGAHLVDVFSPSIWAGWYSGQYSNYAKALEVSRKKYPRFLHAEYGGDSHIGRHTERNAGKAGLRALKGWEEQAVQTSTINMAQYGDWSETYIVDLFDWHLHVSEQLPDFTGSAQWVFKDFATPLRPENPIPYINQKGLCDREGKPKDAYYVYKSYWTQSPVFAYIESHSWTQRYGAKDSLCAFRVYSNAPVLYLVIDGDTLVQKRRDLNQFPACGLEWKVKLSEGKHKLQVFQPGMDRVLDSLSLQYFHSPPSAPEEIRLSYTTQAHGSVLVQAEVVDKQGRRCTDYQKRIYFSNLGVGTLKVSQGTPMGSEVIEAANGIATIELIPAPEGAALIEVRNQDFKGAYLKIDFGEQK